MAYGVTSWIDNKSVSICQRSSGHSSVPCDGLRSTSPRSFASTPLLLPIEINGAPWKTCSPTIMVAGQTYNLQIVTYGSGGHFCSSIKMNNQWWLYDGLKEYNRVRSGLKRQPRPIAPPRYRRIFCLYVQQ
jgi:hypothetical protein